MICQQRPGDLHAAQLNMSGLNPVTSAGVVYTAVI